MRFRLTAYLGLSAGGGLLLHAPRNANSLQSNRPIYPLMHGGQRYTNEDDPLMKFRVKSGSRRSVLRAGLFGGFLGGGGSKAAAAGAERGVGGGGNVLYKSRGPTNEVVKVVQGMKRRRLGGSDIAVSELGLGTQRWCVVVLRRLALDPDQAARPNASPFPHLDL